jgi:hypothetical protein
MPDDPRQASSPPASGEFNFDDLPPVDNPRMKRRSLTPRPGPAPQPADEEPASEPEPDRLESTASAPAATPRPAENSAPARTVPAAAASSPRPAQTAAPGRTIPATGYVSRPAASTPSSTTPAPGLYYSSGVRREPDRPTTSSTQPMKPTTPTPAPTGASASTVSTYRAPQGAAPCASTASDFRANIDRQSREQKSVGDVLAYIVYAIGALLVIGAGLAIYGGYTLSRQIHEQSVTMSDLDARYAAQNKDLTAALGTTNDSLSQAQAQIRRQEEMIGRQQDTINKLVTTNDEIVNALKQERLQRASETANLRARVRSLEDETTPAH